MEMALSGSNKVPENKNILRKDSNYHDNLFE